MNINTKLRLFFEAKNISNKELASIINYSEVMVSRYLRINKPNYEFLKAVKDNFPELDLNNLFVDELDLLLKEEDDLYKQDGSILIDEIEINLKN